jgi:thiol-disulfide isomerase/thioredoxin
MSLLPALALAIAGLLVGQRALAQDKDKLLSKSDSLTDKDQKDTKMKNSYRKVFTVKLTEGQAYKIDLSSTDFDTFLRLENAKGKELAFNDDIDPKNLDSRLIFVAPKTEEYKIIATTFEAGKTGLFTVEVAKATEEEAKEARLVSQVERYASLSEADRQDVMQRVTKRFQDRDGKLTIPDAQLAIQLYFASEDVNIKHAKEVNQALVKIFEGAENKQVAGVTKFFESSFRQAEKFLGKEMVITGKTVDGKDFDLKNLKGKVVLVDFWATWCGPCVAEMPNMLEAHAKYNKKGFEIIGVSLDRTDDAITKFNEDRKIPWNSINIEDSRTLATKYGVNAIPFPVLVDRAGNVVSLRARGPQLDRLLDRLFAEKKE